MHKRESKLAVKFFVICALLTVPGLLRPVCGLSLEQKCQAKRFQAKGKYERCVSAWRANYYSSGQDVYGFDVLSKCRIKYDRAWTRLQKLEGTSCDASRFEDNGLSIKDNLTGLIWEKKTEDTVNDKFTWTVGPDAGDDVTNEDGTAFTEFLRNLNETEFDGASGWRMPTFTELQTIRLPAEHPCPRHPCINPVFDPTAATLGSAYWSSSTLGVETHSAWGVDFNGGFAEAASKGNAAHVRAVRGGF